MKRMVLQGDQAPRFFRIHLEALHRNRDWSIPALYSGMAGPDYAELGWISFLIVLITGLAGLIATLAWWQMADQTN